MTSSMMMEFLKGKKAECYSWKDFLTAIGGCVSVLESILLSPKVVGLSHQIREDFAFQTLCQEWWAKNDNFRGSRKFLTS
jgi:hypothetical protein